MFSCCRPLTPADMVEDHDLSDRVRSQYFKTHYLVLDEVIGEGTFSVVRPAVDRKSGERVAVKIVDRAAIAASEEDDLRREVSILQKLRHPNIVQLIDFFEESFSYVIVMEYVAGGELFNRIVKKTFYNEKEARDCVSVLLSAVKYLHDRDIVHRDLKPENLLLKSQSDDADVKLADFGFATFVEGDRDCLTRAYGSPDFVAPEILRLIPYGKPVDMWSLGVITFVLLAGYPPFYHPKPKELKSRIKSGTYEFLPAYWVTLLCDHDHQLFNFFRILYHPMPRISSRNCWWLIHQSE